MSDLGTSRGASGLAAVTRGTRIAWCAISANKLGSTLTISAWRWASPWSWPSPPSSRASGRRSWRPSSRGPEQLRGDANRLHRDSDRQRRHQSAAVVEPPGDHARKRCSASRASRASRGALQSSASDRHGLRGRRARRRTRRPGSARAGRPINRVSSSPGETSPPPRSNKRIGRWWSSRRARHGPLRSARIPLGRTISVGNCLPRHPGAVHRNRGASSPKRTSSRRATPLRILPLDAADRRLSSEHVRQARSASSPRDGDASIGPKTTSSRRCAE